MKISRYRDFIKKEFETIQKKYDMNWIDESEYGMTLKNKFVYIEFFTERGQTNDSIGLPIVDISKDEFYNLNEIMDRLGLQGNFATDEMKLVMKSLNDIVEITIYTGRVLLEEHAYKIFQGDFSQIGPGTPM